jgi:hypothetical protein
VKRDGELSSGEWITRLSPVVRAAAARGLAHFLVAVSESYDVADLFLVLLLRSKVLGPFIPFWMFIRMVSPDGSVAARGDP